MSYDIYFLRRAPGQSWEDAMAAMEEDAMEDRQDQAGNGEALSRPAQWDEIVAGVRELLGDVDVTEGPPNWEIDDPRTAIQVSCFTGEWSMTVPYWWDGEHAEAIAGYLRAIAGIVHDATGLEAYDPQVDAAVTSEEWMTGKAAAIFDEVAESFDRRGITRHHGGLS
jgi:hypothetical protein